jgi:hypothetical protein
MNHSSLPTFSIVIMLQYGYSPLKKQSHRCYGIEEGSALRDVIPRCTFHFVCWRSRCHFSVVNIIGLIVVYSRQLGGGADINLWQASCCLKAKLTYVLSPVISRGNVCLSFIDCLLSKGWHHMDSKLVNDEGKLMSKQSEHSVSQLLCSVSTTLSFSGKWNNM